MKKKSVGLLELETAVLECFLEKTPLSPLGVKTEVYFVRNHCRYCIVEWTGWSWGVRKQVRLSYFFVCHCHNVYKCICT
jgi:hypothetical protein